MSENGDWCLIEGAEITEKPLSLFIDELRWRAVGLGSVKGRQEITVVLDGLRMVAFSGSPWIDQMMVAQSHHNVATGEASVAWQDEKIGFSFRISVENGFEVSFVFDGADPENAVFRGQPMIDGVVRYASLQVVNEGSFDTMLFSMLTAALQRQEGSPKVLIDEWRNRLKAKIVDVPHGLVGRNGRFAMENLIAELPMPHGELTVTIDAESGFQTGPLVQAIQSRDWPEIDGLPALFGGETLHIWYDNASTGPR